MNTTSQERHDITGLLAELDAAEQEFNTAADLVEAAITFLSTHKGRLNEHQFVQKLEAASSDATRAAEIIDEQHRLRCRYMSGRLALFCSFSQLTRGLRSRDKLVRTIMKIVATIPHVKDTDERDLLGSRCLTVAQRSQQKYKELLERHEREAHKDLTNGEAGVSMRHLYQALFDKGVSGLEIEPRQVTIVEMVLIPLAATDLREYRFEGTDLNDRLVTEVNALIALLKGAEYSEPWKMYHIAKTALNEPQYASRLQQMLTATPPNPAGVEVVKNQQCYARIDFLTHRANVTAVYNRLKALADVIDGVVDDLKDAIERDTMAGATYKLVAMNNILAARAVTHKVRKMAERWGAELQSTAENRQISERSLFEVLGALVSAHPYRGLSWSCYGPGQYTEPL